MKKKKIPEQKLKQLLKPSLSAHYSKMHSEQIKRGIQAKKKLTEDVKTAKLKDLKTGHVLNILPNSFIERVVKYKSTLSEVETSSVVETLLNFQRDHLPERELQVWEQITNMYLDGCNNNQNWNLADKKRYFKVVLARSSGING